MRGRKGAGERKMVGRSEEEEGVRDRGRDGVIYRGIEKKEEWEERGMG